MQAFPQGKNIYPIYVYVNEERKVNLSVELNDSN